MPGRITQISRTSQTSILFSWENVSFDFFISETLNLVKFKNGSDDGSEFFSVSPFTAPAAEKVLELFENEEDDKVYRINSSQFKEALMTVMSDKTTDGVRFRLERWSF